VALLVLIFAVWAFFAIRSWQLDRKVEAALDGRYYKFQNDDKRIDLDVDDGEFTINQTDIDDKTKTIVNYSYRGDVNGTELKSDEATKQEYVADKPKDTIKVDGHNYKLDSYSKQQVKLHATSGDDINIYTLTSDGSMTVEAQKNNLLDWIIQIFRNVWNSVANWFK
jgi:hypothetical protein